MNARNMIALVLGIFVGFAVVRMLVGEATSDEPSTTATPHSEQQPSDELTAEPADEATELGASVIHAYYFHRTQRCVTCRAIETASQTALEASFADALEQGDLVWTPINLDEPRHEHFIQDFELVMSGVVLAEEQDGKPVRWENLDDVWRLARDRDRLAAYVTEKTQAFLDAGSSDG